MDIALQIVTKLGCLLSYTSYILRKNVSRSLLVLTFAVPSFLCKQSSIRQLRVAKYIIIGQLECFEDFDITLCLYMESETFQVSMKTCMKTETKVY